MHPSESPVIIVRTRRPRGPHPSALATLMPVLSVVWAVGLVGLIAYAMSLGPRKPTTVSKVAPPKVVTVAPRESARPLPQRGAGRDARQVRHVVYDKSDPRTRTSPTPVVGAKDHIERADALVVESLGAAKEGLFVKANDLAQDALRLCPDHPAATGAWYLAAYAQQYTKLADEALERLNGDVDLGSKYGIAAFIERNGDTYTFRCRGANRKFTSRQLGAMNGVRFRITRQFLDNAENPANDLILAAVHYLKSIDTSGNQNLANPAASLDAAVTRCTNATRGADGLAEHAGHVLALFRWLEARPAVSAVARVD